MRFVLRLSSPWCMLANLKTLFSVGRQWIGSNRLSISNPCSMGRQGSIVFHFAALFSRSVYEVKGSK